MGILVIFLKEGKNLETKETSDPYVSFKVVNNAELQQNLSSSSSSAAGEQSMRAKSKVIRKTSNPLWNQTLTIPMPNTTQGFSLQVCLKEHKVVGHNESLGEATIILDELKSAITKEYSVNFNQGVLLFALTHKPDFKSRVNVVYANDAPVSYELLRGVKLSTQIDLLCQLFKISGNYSSFVLQIKDQIITEQNLTDPKYEIPDGTEVNLVIRPNLQVLTTLEALKNDFTKKKAIFDLKTQLQQPTFAEEFLAQDGVSAITDLIIVETGNTLAYAINALDVAMTYGFGWDHLSGKVIEKIVSLFESTNVNVKSGALRIAGHLAGSKKHGYPAINATMEKLDSTGSKTHWFAKVISNFCYGEDVNVQLSSLIFLNAMLNSAPPSDREDLIQLFENQSLPKHLKAQLGTADALYKAQIVRYLKIKNNVEADPQPYNKDNPAHEKMLMDLWNAVYPQTKLDARVSEQWKLFGFQGTDPATDFRGMGIVGLKFFLYFAKNYTDILKGMIDAQADNNETYYPIAVAGINLAKLVFEIFKDMDDKYLPIMFDHPQAVAEVFSIALRYFDQAWEEMEATYFNFNTVIATVEQQILSNLRQSTSLEQFRNLSSVILKEDKKDQPEKKKKRMGFFNRSEKKGSNPKLITSKKVDQSWMMLHEAVKNGNTKKAADLIREGVPVNVPDEKGWNALYHAVVKGNLDMVRLLLWKDGDVDTKSSTGWTCLHEASKTASLEIIDVLLSKGANPNAETSDGVSPLHYLVGRKFPDVELHMQILEEMLSCGADINNNKNQNQETPLHYAVNRGSADCVRFLLQHGSELNIKNQRGYTPLHIAILQGQADVVLLLVQYGADTTIACKEGTPADLAKHAPSQSGAQILQYLSNKPVITDHPARRESVVNSKIGTSFAQLSALDNLKCWHPDISKNDAESMVLAMKQTVGQDCYLLRPSAVRGCYDLTMSGKDSAVHFLISTRPNGQFAIDDSDDTNTYATVKELVETSNVTANKVAISSKRVTLESPKPAAVLQTQLESTKKLLEEALHNPQDARVWTPKLKEALETLKAVL